MEIPPVRTSVCPTFGRKQLNECPRRREFLGQPSRQEKHSASSAVSSGFASSSVFFMFMPSITTAVFIFEVLYQFFFLANNLSAKNNAYFTGDLYRNYCSHCIPSLFLVVLLYIKLLTRVDTPISHVTACPYIRRC